MKSVVITGCSAGVGRSAALLFDRMNWRVFAIVRKQDDADSLEAAASGQLRCLLADVGDRDDVFAAAKEVERDIGTAGLDGLICNAGIGGAGPLECLSLAEMQKPLDTNFYGSLFCAQAFLPLLRTAHGRIVLVTSGSTLFTMPMVSTYPAAKYALELVARQLRVEVAQFNIPVIVVDPGHIRSRMTLSAEEQNQENRKSLPPEAFELYGTQLDRLDKTVTAMVGSGKDPEIVARAYLRALTDERPKRMYTVGADAKVMRTLARWAPRRLLDAMAARIMRN